LKTAIILLIYIQNHISQVIIFLLIPPPYYHPCLLLSSLPRTVIPVLERVGVLTTYAFLNAERSEVQESHLFFVAHPTGGYSHFISTCYHIGGPQLAVGLFTLQIQFPCNINGNSESVPLSARRYMHHSFPKIARFAPTRYILTNCAKIHVFPHSPKTDEKSKKAFITKTNPFRPNPMKNKLVHGKTGCDTTCHQNVTRTEPAHPRLLDRFNLYNGITLTPYRIHKFPERFTSVLVHRVYFMKPPIPFSSIFLLIYLIRDP